MFSQPLYIDPHPELELEAFITTFPKPLGELTSPDWLRDLLTVEAAPPLERTEAVRLAVRDMMRHGGYKPSGRGKPASEYLVRTSRRGRLGSINPAVDTCNVVSLHSGLPISVIDPDRAQPPFRVGLPEAGASYVFNASGQTIKLDGLVCLHDAEGPCANGVKDSERTKTHEDTRRTLSVIWGVRTHADHTARAAAWYRDLLKRLLVS